MTDTASLFDTVADRYDRVRPGYPPEMWGGLAAIAGMRHGAEVLEVGCGTGQATRGLLDRGWRVLAIEPGPALADRARHNLPGDAIDVTVNRFEDWDPAGRRFDLVFSATAYHWIDPAVRWSKAAAVLRRGGHIALATNHTVSGGTFPALYEAAAGLHARFAPEIGGGPAEAEGVVTAALAAPAQDIGRLWGRVEAKAGDSTAAGCFGPPVVRWYGWETEYSAADAVALLSTYSPYLTLPTERREPLLAGIHQLIERRMGGAVTRRYLTILAVARLAGSPHGG